MPEVQFPIPDVPITDPKTGRFTAQGRWFLHEILQRIGGLGDITGLFTTDIGVTVQAWDAELDAIAALTPTDNNFIVGNGSTWITESGATALTSLGAQADLDVVSQADAEAGTATDERIWTAERVKQAIVALETAGDVVDDTTPQLGGNLDVNGNSIVSASAGDIAITPDSTGDIILDGQKWPQADGTNSQILETDGSGQTGWVDAPAGSGDALPVVDTKNVVKGSADATKQVRIEADTNITTGTTRVITMADEDIDLTPGTGSFATEAEGGLAATALQDLSDDTTPQFGADVDMNGNSIVSASAGDIPITPDTTGDLILDGLKWPQADGTADQVLKTDGAAQLSFVAQSGGITQEELSESPITPDNTVALYDIDVSTYVEVEITLDGVGFASSDSTHIRFSDDSGVTFEAAASDYRALAVTSAAEVSQDRSTLLFNDGSTTSDVNGSARFSNLRAGRATMTGYVGNGGASARTNGGFANFDGPITDIRILTGGANNFNAGTIRVIGIK